MEGEAVKMKRFDKAFKVQAVKMVTEEGQKTSEVARSLGIHANVLYNWKQKYDPYGNLFPCNSIRELKVNLLKEDIEYARSEIVNWARTTDFSRDSICKNCSIRSICYNCPGKALLETGKLEERVGWFCELAHLKRANKATPHLYAQTPDTVGENL